MLGGLVALLLVTFTEWAIAQKGINKETIQVSQIGFRSFPEFLRYEFEAMGKVITTHLNEKSEKKLAILCVEIRFAPHKESRSDWR